VGATTVVGTVRVVGESVAIRGESGSYNVFPGLEPAHEECSYPG